VCGLPGAIRDLGGYLLALGDSRWGQHGAPRAIHLSPFTQLVRAEVTEGRNCVRSLVFRMLVGGCTLKRRIQTVFAILELKTATLDYGIVGFSQARMLAIFLLAFAVPMIPYLFLYLSLGDKKSQTVRAGSKFFAWTHPHRHPELLRH
jgi:hypothetical protein